MSGKDLPDLAARINKLKPKHDLKIIAIIVSYYDVLMETILIYTFSHIEQVLLHHNNQHNDTQHKGLKCDTQNKW